MVFNSYGFILIFLPLTFFAFALAHRFGGWTAAFNVLAIASLVFYAQWSLTLLGILLVSVVSNFVVGNILIFATRVGKPALTLLISTIVGNILTLGYFKYSNFFIDIANQISGSGYTHLDIILPIGISFYTFIQIGFLIEAYAGKAEQPTFMRYLMFSTFFPCVTAGPLVLQREIFDQMKNRTDRALDFSRIAAGMTMFSIGMFKKVMLADSIAPYANTTFDGVAQGQSIEIMAAWAGAVAYTLQLYFDFSGYTDMALGLAAIFGITLPLNFNSPFKALSISDFWQRWHMTMTRFFTTYVYSPLAMSGMRRAMTGGYSPVRNFMVSGALPIFITMLIAGVWHGSGWVFVIYGLLHGTAIAVNNAWKQFNGPQLPPVAAWLLTMSVVVSGLVIFRSPDVTTALTILSSMWGISMLQAEAGTQMVSLAYNELLPMIAVFGGIVMLAPNTQEILRHYWLSSSPKPETVSALAEKFAWKPVLGWSFASTAAFVVTFANIGTDSSFLYYQF